MGNQFGWAKFMGLVTPILPVASARIVSVMAGISIMADSIKNIPRSSSDGNQVLDGHDGFDEAYLNRSSEKNHLMTK